MEDEVEIRIALENHTTRLNSLESQIRELNSISASIQDLTISVNKLAINMEHMLEEQKNQGVRIKTLENEPANTWLTAKKTILSTVLSTLAGAFAVGAIMLIAKYL